jgi:hypothetical protein
LHESRGREQRWTRYIMPLRKENEAENWVI